MITCGIAKNTGRVIQESLGNVALSDASIKQSQQAITLPSLKASIKMGKQTVAISPMVLFSCLVVLLQTTNDISSYFAYELAPVPTAIFKDNMMRKPNTSSLAKGLDAISEKKKKEGNILDIESDDQSSDEGDADDSSTDSDSEDSDDADIENVEGVNEENVLLYFIDGGYLLRRVVSDKQSTYHEVIQKYINYVESHYGKRSIVFDGYQDGPSTKDHEHARRTMKSKKSPNVSVHLENWIGNISQQAFLVNNNKKQCFLELLLRALFFNDRGYVVADTSIVSTVLDFACAGENVYLIAADTDLLIMLICMWRDTMGQIKMKIEGTRKYKELVCDIGQIANTLGDIQKYLTFIYAFGGCDTTSAIFGQGKKFNIKTTSQQKAKPADVFFVIQMRHQSK